jgi:hypothetical protein
MIEYPFPAIRLAVSDCDIGVCGIQVGPQFNTFCSTFLNSVTRRLGVSTYRRSWPESIAALDQPSQSCLKLYSQLKKAESSALFQARTGGIGLRRFLASVKVPGVESEECLCEKGKETAEHVLLYCDNTPQRAWSRGAQFRKLASEPAAVGQIARQLIQCGRLGQFRLASRLLYSR